MRRVRTLPRELAESVAEHGTRQHGDSQNDRGMAQYRCAQPQCAAARSTAMRTRAVVETAAGSSEHGSTSLVYVARLDTRSKDGANRKTLSGTRDCLDAAGSLAGLCKFNRLQLSALRHAPRARMSRRILTGKPRETTDVH